MTFSGADTILTNIDRHLKPSLGLINALFFTNLYKKMDIYAPMKVMMDV